MLNVQRPADEKCWYREDGLHVVAATDSAPQHVCSCTHPCIGDTYRCLGTASFHCHDVVLCRMFNVLSMHMWLWVSKARAGLP